MEQGRVTVCHNRKSIVVSVEVTSKWLEARFNLPAGSVLGLVLPDGLEVDITEPNGQRSLLNGQKTVLLLRDNVESTSLEFVHTGFYSTMGSYVALGNCQELRMNGQHNFSIEAWVMVSNFTTQTEGYENTIIGIDDYGNGAFVLCFTHERKLSAAYYAELHLISSYVFEPNTFYHIAVIWNIDTQSFTLYVNGCLDLLPIQHPPRLPTPKLCHLNLGRYAYGRELFGMICELRLWNVCIDESQVRENMYKRIIPKPETMTLSWYDIISKTSKENTKQVLICEYWHPDYHKFSPADLKKCIWGFLMALSRRTDLPKLPSDVLFYILSFLGPIYEFQ